MLLYVLYNRKVHSKRWERLYQAPLPLRTVWRGDEHKGRRVNRKRDATASSCTLSSSSKLNRIDRSTISDTQQQNHVTRVEHAVRCQTLHDVSIHYSCSLVSQVSKTCLEGQVENISIYAQQKALVLAVRFAKSLQKSQ